MNKKADIEISLKTLIGFILVGIIFLAFIGFFVKLWGIFLNKPNEATLNSFKNLVYELNTLEEGQEKIVPFFVQDGLFLRTECHIKGHAEEPVLNDLCICTINCNKRHIREAIELKIPVFIETSDEKDEISYNSNQKVRNLKLKRYEKGICVYDIANEDVPQEMENSCQGKISGVKIKSS